MLAYKIDVNIKEKSKGGFFNKLTNMLRKSGKKKKRDSRTSKMSSSRKSRFESESDVSSKKSIDPFSTDIRNSFEMPVRKSSDTKSSKKITKKQIGEIGKDFAVSEKVLKTGNFKKESNEDQKQEVIDGADQLMKMPKGMGAETGNGAKLEAKPVKKSHNQESSHIESTASETQSESLKSEESKSSDQQTQSECYSSDRPQNDFEPGAKAKSVQIQNSQTSSGPPLTSTFTGQADSLLSKCNKEEPVSRIKKSKTLAYTLASMESLPIRKTQTNLYSRRDRGGRPAPSGKRRKSRSEIRIKPRDKKIRSTIVKDVLRTYQGERYFKLEETKLILETVLYNYSLRSTYQYVQGMNFVAASIIHHSLNYELVFNIFLFIQGN